MKPQVSSIISGLPPVLKVITGVPQASDSIFTVGKLSSGYYEQKDFIYNLENILLTPSEKEKVGAVELKKTNQAFFMRQPLSRGREKNLVNSPV